MFDVKGSDISQLGDADLRTLVARLAAAELRKQGCPLSAVTAGGNQDAADGGLDVRVQCPIPIANPDFVPRRSTGFQVKKPDMPSGAIKDEMRPKPKGGGESMLRPVIRDLATESGAYIIVSSQGSVADKPLGDRRLAMRDALHDLPQAGNLHTDFYDRDRIANWVNEYPGIAAWVRTRVGLGLSGWSSMGGWSGTQVIEDIPYLFDDKACLTDERSSKREQLTIVDGIKSLRDALRTPKQCIRLIGLSGLGKTRLVQALFETGVGDLPLDPSLAIYTDYSAETVPAARDMARQLILRGQYAILIVDNCNPATHTELARICTEETSKITLLTVEYDVRDDEPERTEVFRLQSASPELVSEWLKQSRPDVSEVDRRTIAVFSDGNFRVARALAETLARGETLGKIKSRELFERIFQQRNQPDQNLLAAAEDLSLLYSIDGEDTSADGELAQIGKLTSIGVATLYAALTELRRRGIVQVRGRWRAVLPHAIANPLATYALQRITPPDFDRFSAALTPRMQKSLSRRIGYLHDSPEAQGAVARWLRNGGPLGNLVARGQEGLEILSNIAPVAPEAVLARIEHALDGQDGAALLSPAKSDRWQWVQLIKALGYEPHLFDKATTLLGRFIAAEPADHKQNSARDAFADGFHLYLSGTKATPEQRRAFVRRLANSGDANKRRCASIALAALLTTHSFSSSSNFDFGARSRDWGWLPKLHKDEWDWYDGAIDLAVELSSILPDVRQVLADSARYLWRFGTCQNTLERAASTLHEVRPWIEGWIAFRVLLSFDGNSMPDPVRKRLEVIIQRLKPADLLNRARAVVLNRHSGGWDIADGECDDGDVVSQWHKASQIAVDIGQALAQDSETRRVFLTELMTDPYAPRAFECGRGLAERASDFVGIWNELIERFEIAEPKNRNSAVLGGFLYEANLRDSTFATNSLEAAAENTALVGLLPYLQARIGIDEEGITRLRRAIGHGVIQAFGFRNIANGIVGDSPPDALAELLRDIAAMSDGVEIALDILHMHFHRDDEAGRQRNSSLIELGRDLLRRADFNNKGTLRDYALHTIIRVCCAGGDGEATGRDICDHVRRAMEGSYISYHDLSYVLRALFEVQPAAALDVFLLNEASANPYLTGFDFNLSGLLEDMNFAILRRWAGVDAAARYNLLGHVISMFSRQANDQDNGISPLFLNMLDHAPDKRAFLGDFWIRLHPRSWSGSLIDILLYRRVKVLTLCESSYAEVRQWVDEILPELDRWIEDEQGRDREREESFE